MSQFCVSHVAHKGSANAADQSSHNRNAQLRKYLRKDADEKNAFIGREKRDKKVDLHNYTEC
jgi:hypothetical protein